MKRSLFGRRAGLALAAILLVGVLPLSAGYTAPAPVGAASLFNDGLMSKIAADPAAITDALISVEGKATLADAAALKAIGVNALRVFDEFGIIYAAAPGTNLLRLAGLARVQHVRDNAKIEFAGDTDTVATRAREAWDTKVSSKSPVKVRGKAVKGTGVGVAIIDSGINGEHPDLTSAMASNRKYVCSTPFLINPPTRACFGNWKAGDVLGTPLIGCQDELWNDMTDTDTTSGHGTHVAGIVAGRGTASSGRFTGSAPDARLHGFGVGEGISILAAVEAFNWIDCHPNVVPKIKVISNSWGIRGGGGAFDATDAINKAVDKLVGKGITVLWAAGNDGGTGSADVVNTYSKNPTPGVISVANVDDLGNGSRTAGLNSSSSRGLSTDPDRNNWPDVASPGTNVISTSARTGAAVPPGFALQYSPYYTGATGTSMSTPGVAGIVALLLQAKPTLTPAQIEDILEDNAFQFTTTGGYVADATNATNGTNFGAGHGLVDAIAALHDARVGADGGSSLPQVSQNPHIYTQATIDGQLVAPVQWTTAKGVLNRLSQRSITTGNAAVWPVALGQAARFWVKAPGTKAVLLPASVAADGTTAFRINADYTFTVVGVTKIEAQINFGSGFVSTVAWTVNVVA